MLQHHSWPPYPSFCVTSFFPLATLTSHPSVFTTHGTLLSHSVQSASPSALKKSLIKFAPFAGATWRNHSAQIAATGTTRKNIPGVLPGMTTLGFNLNGEGDYATNDGEVSINTELRQLSVEMDGMVSIIREVVPRLLVAAQLESWRFEGEQDEVARQIEGLKVKDDVEEAPGDSKDEAAGHEGESEEGLADSGGRQLENEGTPDADRRAKKPSKMRILELKAEGMAESLADDYPEKLPHDFY